MTSETISLIAVVISGINAIITASIPAILSYQAKKNELKAKKLLEKEKAYNDKFQEFYQRHLKILTDFHYYYNVWKADPQKSAQIIEYIQTIAPEFRLWVSEKLKDFANKIANYKEGDNLDSVHKLCVQLILASYGVRVTAETPDYLMSEILKVVLKERFDELQKASSKNFHFLSR